MYIISRCLLGDNCKYDGGNNANQDVIEFCKTHTYTTVCPEEAAWLDQPRDPAEIVDPNPESLKVLDKSGKDLTDDFLIGARWSLKSAELEAGTLQEPIEGAILKANSPSCGFGKIYSGKFDGELKDGNGVFVEMLLDEFNYMINGGRSGAEGFFFSPDFKIANENNFKEAFGIK